MRNFVSDIKDALFYAHQAAQQHNKEFSVVYLPNLGTATHMATDSDPEAYGWEIITTIKPT